MVGSPLQRTQPTVAAQGSGAPRRARRGWTPRGPRDHDAAMGMRRLDGADGFVVSDLDGLERHGGVARCAPKVLADSAWLLARCATYQFASLELPIGGASVGINAAGDGRADGVTAAVSALTGAVGEGLFVDAGRGLTDGDLAPLHALDGRPPAYHELRSTLTGEGVAAAVGSVRPLEGASVAIESLDEVAVAFAIAVVRQGGRVVAVARGGDVISAPGGIDPEALAGVVSGGTNLNDLGSPITAAELLGTEATVLAVGSKLGAIDHEAAASVAAGVVAPIGWVPVTTRALAVLGRREITVLPDFIALGGPMVASGLTGPPATGSEAVTAAAALVTAMVGEAAGAVDDDHPSLVLAACGRAESYLIRQGVELPTSRPLG